MRVTTYSTILNEDRLCLLVKEKSVNYHERRYETPEKIYRMLCDVYNHDKQTEEYLFLLCFDAKQKLLGVFELSHGAATYTVCNTREIFQKALLCNAVHIVLAHNHCSGEVEPSQADIKTCNEVKQIGDLMKINLVDNIIVGENEYFSFSEKGLLN